MKLGPVYALCDAIKAAILAAHPDWVVAVVTDPQVEVGKLTTDRIDLGPLGTSDVRPEDRSRYGIDSQMDIALRLRGPVKAGDDETVHRARATKMDQIVDLIQKRASFTISGVGQAVFMEGRVEVDLNSFREDRVASLVGAAKFEIHRVSS